MTSRWEERLFRVRSLRLAWRNLLFDRARFAVTVAGIAFAVFLMLFQGSLLAGFVRASSRVVDATDVDLWVMGRGVPAFDFPAPLQERFRSLALGLPGVVEVYRMAVGLTQWQKPNGGWQSVLVLGSDPGVGPSFPRVRLPGVDVMASQETVMLDESKLAELGVSSLPADVEIRKRRARVAGAVTGFGSFIATPYIFTTFRDAREYLGFGREELSYLLCRVAPGADLEEVRAGLQRRLPDVDVWTREEFSTRGRIYWVGSTGAGGALLMAGLLGFIIGVVIVSQTTYAATMESLEEFATLKAMGAPRGYIRGLVLLQALTGGLVGYAMGTAACFPALALLRRSAVSWAHTPWWMPPAMLLVSLVMCALASLVSVRKALTVEPARVFRA